ncbi:MAG TPA: DUF4129 domain-containing protein, partial [Ktedonobacteraceae bacterium]|nr:DUF4129 domain-containing protein [Ktedonobacteraceae bacterium]
LILVLWLAGFVLTGKNAPLVLDPATILLLLLGLHWWAIGVRKFQQPISSETRTLLFHLGGPCLALALVVGMHLSLIDQPLALFLTTIVVLWCWLRGMTRTRASRRDEHMKTVFQRAFFMMLAFVMLSALVPSLATELLAPLTLALPLFFLSGLVLFSLLRLKTTGQAYQRRFTQDQRADPTRLWSVLVTVFWTSMVTLAFFVETAAFPLVLVLLAPLLAPLASAFRNLNAFLDALLQQKPIAPLIIHKKITLLKQLPAPPFHNPVLVVILTLITFGMMGLILVIVIKIWHSNYHYTREDETRQGIALRAVRKERQQKRASSAREQLDPISVRAHYREFLRLMARQGTSLERFPYETPSEYQQRLYSVLESLPPQQQERFPDAILDELTGAYMQERYGGKRLDDRPYTYWHTRIRALVKRFRRRSRKRDHLSIEEIDP